MCKTAIFLCKELASYGFGNSHPFSNDRMYSFETRFNFLKLDKSPQISILKPEIANEDEIMQFHDKNYLERVKDLSNKGNGVLDLGDTPAFRGMYGATCYVVGTSLKALEFVMDTKEGIIHAFSPIGGLHHARRDRAGGFCIFNDINIMIMVARKKFNIQRICYVDIDAHHGDGVYYAFENDPFVFIADIHEDGRYLYPGTGNEIETGKGEAQGTKMNIPLKPYSNDEDFIIAFKKVEEFIKEKSKPELIILQCGADCIAGDPLTHLAYSSRAHRYAADRLHILSHTFCNGRIIALGGGGYNQINIADAWTEVVKSFIDGN